MDDLIENKRKRLIFRSNHRGTKEMDLIMGSFAAAHVPSFSEDELASYAGLLEENDPDLYNWISGTEQPPQAIAALAVFQKLIKHKLV
jgi:antitoxin CptB